MHITFSIYLHLYMKNRKNVGFKIPCFYFKQACNVFLQYLNILSVIQTESKYYSFQNLYIGRKGFCLHITFRYSSFNPVIFYMAKNQKKWAIKLPLKHIILSIMLSLIVHRHGTLSNVQFFLVTKRNILSSYLS